MAVFFLFLISIDDSVDDVVGYVFDYLMLLLFDYCFILYVPEVNPSLKCS